MSSYGFNLEATLLADIALKTWQNDIKEGMRNITWHWGLKHTVREQFHGAYRHLPRATAAMVYNFKALRAFFGCSVL